MEKSVLKTEELRQQVEREIDGHLSVHERWVGGDWNRSQYIAGVSLVASFIATVWSATGYGLDTAPGLRVIVAVVSAIPALMVALESGFQYSVRARMHTAAIYTLKKLKLRLAKGDDPLDVAEALYTYMIEYSAAFPSGSASPRIGSATTSGSSSKPTG